MNRATAPAWMLCAPLVQFRSSLNVWTGMIAVKFREVGMFGSTPRKVTIANVCRPVESQPCRVRP